MAEGAVGVALAFEGGGGDSESMVDRWTDSFSSTSFVVMELMIP